MNVINIYLRGLENLAAFFDRIENKNKSVLFTRVPGIKNIKSEKAKRIIWGSCIAVEPFVSLAIETVMLIPNLFKSAVTRKKGPAPDRLFLAHCPLLKQRTISAGVYDDAKDWLYAMSTSKADMDASKTVHSIFEQLNVIDVLWSYCMAVAATFASIKVTKFKYVMRNYPAFEYCLTYRYLSKIPKSTTICFSNQIDKWALLFDNAPQNKILFQHGIETPDADWPNKLRNVDTVYVLSKNESELLFRAAFSRKPSDVHIMAPTITLTPVDKDKYTILIVGFPGYGKFDKEQCIIKTFSQAPYYVYLKPHPGKEDMTRYRNLTDAHPDTSKLVMEQMFPDVDVVISYRSTLAVEYQAHDKKVLLYNDYSIDQIIELIRQDSKSLFLKSINHETGL